MPASFRHALVLGKCLPPHQGHLDLITFAAGLSERTTVLVEQRPDEAVPVATRCTWLQAALGGHPHVSVVALEGDHPQAPPEDAEGARRFWAHWASLIRRTAGKVDAVVSGDDYGSRLAADQQAVWVPFDRTRVPISATAFKANAWTHWDWLVPAARTDLLRRVLIVGAESTGKSTLAARLAASSQPPTVVIPEYAEHWLRRHPETAVEHLPWDLFLSGQSASRTAWAARANRWVMEDSNALTTAVWASLSGRPDVVERAMASAASSPPHHVLLSLSDGVPWVADFHRRRPDNRPEFDAEFRRRLDQLGWARAELAGAHEARWAQASSTLDGWLEGWRQATWPEWARATPAPRPRALGCR